MKKVLSGPLLVVAMLVASASFLQPARAARIELVDRIVAVVNNEAITSSTLDERVEQVQRQFARRGDRLPPSDVLRRQVLEQLVAESAQVQRAKETGLKIDDDALSGAIERIAQSNKMSVFQFRSALENDGISWDAFRNNIRREMLISRLRERDVESRVVVTDAEIDNFLKNNPDVGAGSEFKVQHILLRAPEAASPEQLKALADKAAAVRQRAIAGEDFGALAAEVSNAPDALQGGDLGWRAASALPGLFAQAIQSMQAGDISPVMRSSAGFHIIKLDGKRAAQGGEDMVEQTRVSHILIKTSELVSDDDARKRLETLRTRILNGESFADLARANSADLSAANGGEIGWVYPGDTVPEFERAMNALKPGELSEPVKSPFGWHLIRVEERRKEDVSDKRKRAIARNTLRQRKIEDAYDDWLRQLVSGAFVEYRLEDVY
ncbi:molecular chaperone SurA [Nitrogeniibacter mangrovi]|uniref:Chaperone SurA n=1 Tax=Nitrogeniibacter mangrovi TaxID=2016596 RepID=A0A6C1B1B6_9RHOO|nr:peptidylprolyl isomerase [Nitrogeniibacter mangrovi]QID17153.1 molecular chaperone SurA [Nitrogeniibacter mangrovi]